MTGSRLEEYERALPEGLASYPECQHKAVFYRDFMDHVPLTGIAPRLPKPLRALVEDPVPPTTWVPEVHINALYLATCDLLIEERELVAAMYEVNRRVLSSPLNRIIFMVASPSILFSAGQGRWSAFHRGSDFKTTKHDRGGRVQITYPEHLFPKLMAEVYQGVFQAVFDLLSEGARIHLASWAPTVAHYTVQWG